MYLISLDKKLVTVNHKMLPEKFDEIQTQHELTKGAIQEQIQRELYQQFMKSIYQYIPTAVHVNEETKEEMYVISGYVLSQLAMLELIKECLEMDDFGKDKLLKEVSHAIMYRDKNLK